MTVSRGSIVLLLSLLKRKLLGKYDIERTEEAIYSLHELFNGYNLCVKVCLVKGNLTDTSVW